MLRATAGCRLLLKSKDFGGCDCGGKVFVLGVEAVSPREEVDRRVLTADVDASLGLINCERNGFSQMAKRQSSWRSGAKGSPDSSNKQPCQCKRRWRGTKMLDKGQARRGVVDETCCEWMTSKMRKGATPEHAPFGLSHTHVRVMVKSARH